MGDEDILDVAKKLGRPVPSRRGASLVDSLRPRTREAALPRSLSAIHGVGGFPLHTDGAHWPVPPRYVLLQAKASSECATTLFDSRQVIWSSEQVELLTRGVFYVSDAAGGFPATLLSRGLKWLRFDLGCMTPANGTGIRALDVARAGLNRTPVRLPWQVGMTLVIDNWRCLHGREPTLEDEDRVVMRVLVT